MIGGGGASFETRFETNGVAWRMLDTEELAMLLIPGIAHA
jgi:hypothetical protein